MSKLVSFENIKECLQQQQKNSACAELLFKPESQELLMSKQQKQKNTLTESEHKLGDSQNISKLKVAQVESLKKNLEDAKEELRVAVPHCWRVTSRDVCEYNAIDRAKAKVTEYENHLQYKKALSEYDETEQMLQALNTFAENNIGDENVVEDPVSDDVDNDNKEPEYNVDSHQGDIHYEL